MIEAAKDRERIAQLMLMLDEWLERFHAAPDQKTESEIILKMIPIQREVDAILADQRAALAALLDRARWTMNEDDQVALFLQAFVFAAQQGHFIHDEIGDVNAYNELVKQREEIAKQLDAIGPGRRAALASLLDHDDPGVREIAATYLLKTMPERALPVLRAVAEDESLFSARMDAAMTLSMYERDPDVFK